MGIVLPLIYILVIMTDRRMRTGRERYIFLALAAVSVLLAVPAGIMANYDHVGASLSGIISIFMR